MLPIYKPHKDRNVRIDSAILAIKNITPLNLYPAHKKELLSVCIWKITESDGKKKVRYWSKKATQEPINKLQHEHVFERKELIKRILSGENIDTVVKDAIACLVTKEEHSQLNLVSESGWKRYEKANIKVYDSKNEKWL